MKQFSLYHFIFLTVYFISTSARTSLIPGQSLTGNQTLISENNKYELGFFSPQGTNTSKNYYIGIWYRRISDQTPSWIGNRDAPVSDPNTSYLKLSQDGNLVLLNHSHFPVWSTNYTHNKTENISLVARLLDTGNLVITNELNSSDTIWQSFYHPTNEILIGEWIGINNITGENESLISWRSSADPGSGPYSYQVDPSVSGQCVLFWNQSKSYWYSGSWAGSSFQWMSNMPINANLSYDFVHNQYRQQYRYWLATFSVPFF
jgi:D-mannose binding lectin